MGVMALQRRLAAVQGVFAAPQARQPPEPVIRTPACGAARQNFEDLKNG
jgi:hypothetical protein